MENLILRPGRIDDLDGLERIEQECFASPWSRETLEHDLTNNALAHYYVAEQQGTVIGSISLWLIGDEGHINNVAVLPDYRRNHVAAKLLSYVLKETEARGIQSHTLEVRANNEPAIALYEGFGFESLGIRPNYYEDDGMDALIMWRSPAE